MAMSAAHYAKVNNGMKLFCWQEAIKTLEEVETILDRCRRPSFPRCGDQSFLSGPRP